MKSQKRPAGLEQVSKTGEEGERAIPLKSLLGHGTGFGFFLKSNGKALKMQSLGNDMHSLGLGKNPLVTECTKGQG